MATKKKTSFIKTILNLLVVVPAILNVANKVATLIGYEGRLAGKSLIRILILAFLSAMILASTWACILILLFHYFSMHFSFELSVGFLILINVLFLFIIGFIIARSGKNLTFPLTRKLFLPHKHYEED